MQVGQWTSTCLETCIKRLADLNKPFKYVVTTVIMQKNGRWSPPHLNTSIVQAPLPPTLSVLL